MSSLAVHHLWRRCCEELGCRRTSPEGAFADGMVFEEKLGGRDSSSEQRLTGGVRNCLFILSSNIKTGIRCTLGVQSQPGHSLKQPGVVEFDLAHGRV